jgi:hypothetical protein
LSSARLTIILQMFLRGMVQLKNETAFADVEELEAVEKALVLLFSLFLRC